MSSAATLGSLAKKLPGVRNLRHAPPYFTGSVMANRLGYQVLRALGKRALWKLRTPSVSAEAAKYVRAMAEDGVVVIPDFLPPEQFAQIREEYERAQSGLVFRPLPFYSSLESVKRGRIHAAGFPVEGAGFPRTIEFLVKNKLLWQIVSGVVRVPMRGIPSAQIDVYQKRDEEAPDNDVETVLHADLHSTTVKAFLYLNDVEKSNGAFVYAKGSAHLTRSRLRHEYDISVRTAKYKRGDSDIDPDLLAVRGPNVRNVIRPEYMKAMNVVETSICGKANTLIIANNIGFHRRGDFSSDRVRETIMVNFRHLQRLFWS
jgi:hypothetical protein